LIKGDSFAVAELQQTAVRTSNANNASEFYGDQQISFCCAGVCNDAQFCFAAKTNHDQLKRHKNGQNFRN
jgi:hypothetical protein